MTILEDDSLAPNSLVAPNAPGGAVAVSYLRVSTKEQAEKGGTDEGYLIPPSERPTSAKPSRWAPRSWPSSSTPESPPAKPTGPS